jgi:uncharacterized membrane protein YeaQ/YmgE (transglycosylase-associated protein family)
MPERSILGWLAIGLVAGVLAKLLMPGRDPGGFIVTILIGIAGALLGGFVLSAAGIGFESDWSAYAAAVIGAVVLLLLYRLTIVRRIG